jgi:hypothetical protein
MACLYLFSSISHSYWYNGLGAKKIPTVHLYNLCILWVCGNMKEQSTILMKHSTTLVKQSTVYSCSAKRAFIYEIPITKEKYR